MKMPDQVQNTVNGSPTKASALKIFRVTEPASNSIKKISRVLRLIWIPISLAAILSFVFTSDALMMAIFLTVALILALIDLCLNLLLDPVDNTIIELYTDKMIRSGFGLKHAEIPLKNFGKLWEDKKGIWIFKKGLKTAIKVYTQTKVVLKARPLQGAFKSLKIKQINQGNLVNHLNLGIYFRYESGGRKKHYFYPKKHRKLHTIKRVLVQPKN
ncbi:MAG: hypothetical protein NW226_13675 [Microscillaceae bacterium]|nr:hypothetical protein [Microscillaceae bacterium]